MQIFKKPNFSFMQYKLFAFGLSGIIIIGGIVNITKGKGLRYGIDFAGGSLIRVLLKNDIPIDEVRKSLREFGLEKSQITEIGTSNREYLIRSLQTLGRSQSLEEVVVNKIGRTLEVSVLLNFFSDYRQFELTGPNRVVIELFDTRSIKAPRLVKVDDLGVRRIRTSMPQPNTAQVVIEMTDQILPYRIDRLENGLKILFSPDAADWPEAEKVQAEMDTHEIIGDRVIEALRLQEDKAALERGLKDLNSIDERELTLILEASFPEEASAVAQKNTLENRTFLGSLVVLSKETVGPQVGHDLRRKATQAIVWALIGMLIYIGIRFKFAYGVAAILTLAHDVLITLGLFSLTNREINLPVVAAMLTIVGYSLNDTIVIFDRVRDNLRILRKREFEGILDTSINQTLSRTVITSGTTLTVLALFLFGGEVINDFAFTMIIGVVTGTYSSIYQSCPLLFYWNKIFKPKKGMAK
jgi:preprotein translocase subunit SecF